MIVVMGIIVISLAVVSWIVLLIVVVFGKVLDNMPAIVEVVVAELAPQARYALVEHVMNKGVKDVRIVVTFLMVA